MVKNVLTPAQKSYQRLLSLQFGAVFSGVVALMWTGIFASFLGGRGQIIIAIICSALSVSSVLLGLYIIVVRRVAQKERLPYFSSAPFWIAFYGIVVIEFAVIYLLHRVFQAHHIENVLYPLIVLIVGLHFYPLAYLNNNKPWYMTATILTLAMIGLFLTVHNTASTTLFGAPHSSIWAVVSSSVMVVTMLGTSFASSYVYLHRHRVV